MQSTRVQWVEPALHARGMVGRARTLALSVAYLPTFCISSHLRTPSTCRPGRNGAESWRDGVWGGGVSIASRSEAMEPAESPTRYMGSTDCKQPSEHTTLTHPLLFLEHTASSPPSLLGQRHAPHHRHGHDMAEQACLEEQRSYPSIGLGRTFYPLYAYVSVLMPHTCHRAGAHHKHYTLGRFSMSVPASASASMRMRASRPWSQKQTFPHT